MQIYADDRLLWLLVGIGLVAAARAIPSSLLHIHNLTEITREDKPNKRLSEDAEEALKLGTLQKLIEGNSYELRSSAIKIIAERCTKSEPRELLLRDLASHDTKKRDKAIHALWLLLSNPSLKGTETSGLFTDLVAFESVITALVDLLPLYQVQKLTDPPEPQDSDQQGFSNSSAQQPQKTFRGNHKQREQPSDSLSQQERPPSTLPPRMQQAFDSTYNTAYNTFIGELTEDTGGNAANITQEGLDAARTRAKRVAFLEVGEMIVSTRARLLGKTDISMPSPVKPRNRPPAERTLLMILHVLLLQSRHSIMVALSAGLVSRWLSKYPFPCTLEANGARRQEVASMFNPNAWASDDLLMANIMRLVVGSAEGVSQLERYGLRRSMYPGEQRTTRGGDPPRPTRLADDDIAMTGGESTAGIPRRSESGDNRPGSSWSRRPPDPLRSEAEQARRRRRREAMVISDGTAPLTSGNILQRENSRAPLAPAGGLDVEEALQRLREWNNPEIMEQHPTTTATGWQETVAPDEAVAEPGPLNEGWMSRLTGLFGA